MAQLRTSIDNCFKVIEREIIRVKTKNEEEEASKKANDILEMMRERSTLNMSKMTQNEGGLIGWIKKLKTTKKISKQKIYMLLIKNLFGRPIQSRKQSNNRQSMRISTSFSMKSIKQGKTDPQGRSLGMSLISSKLRQSGKLITGISTINNCVTIFLGNKNIIAISSISFKKIRLLLDFDDIPFTYGPLSFSLFNTKTNMLNKPLQRRNDIFDYDKEYIDKGVTFNAIDSIGFKVNLLPIRVFKRIPPPCEKALQVMQESSEPSIDIFVDNDNIDDFDFIPCLMKIEVDTQNKFKSNDEMNKEIKSLQ